MLTVILIGTDNGNPRAIAEALENQKFQMTERELLTHLETQYPEVEFEVYSLSEFVLGVNDQVLDSLTDCFMSYVYLFDK